MYYTNAGEKNKKGCVRTADISSKRMAPVFGYFGAKMALLIQNISAKLEISKYTRKNAFDIDNKKRGGPSYQNVTPCFAFGIRAYFLKLDFSVQIILLLYITNNYDIIITA